MSDRNRNPDEDVLEKEDINTEKPPRYTCVLHNDDYTTQEFVVMILRKVFRLDESKAFAIMLKVHRFGRGNVGDFTLDVAKTKAAKVEKMAQDQEFPLKCTVEKIS